MEKAQKDFEKIIKTSSFSKEDIEVKQKFLNSFLKKGLPSRKLENWKFSDLSQIIHKNIGEIGFYNDYSISNKVDQNRCPESAQRLTNFGSVLDSSLKISFSL